MITLLLFFIFFYCSLSPMKHSIIDDKELQTIIINYCTAESNKNTDKNNIFDCIHSVWRTNQQHDLAYLSYVYSKIYQASYPSIHNASLQTINTDVLIDEGHTKNQYLHNPLTHGISIKEDNFFTPNAFSYNAFKLAKRKDNTFVFNIFDGPNKKNQWIFSYSTTNPANIMEESFFIIVKLKNPSTINQILTSKRLQGSINAVRLINTENKAYVTTNIINKQTNTHATMLYDIVFSMRHSQISLNTYIIPGISSVKKLLPLTKSLLCILSQDGILHKVDVTRQNTSVINILDIENKKIELDNVVTNPTIPYLWLLVSKASALYLVNFKNKNKKITFSKITNEFTAKNIWFDNDYILAQDAVTTVPIDRPIEKATPLQYSLYRLYMILSKTTFSELSKDSNNVK